MASINPSKQPLNIATNIAKRIREAKDNSITVFKIGDLFKEIDKQNQTNREETFNQIEMELEKENHADIDARKTRNLIQKSYLEEQIEKSNAGPDYNEELMPHINYVTTDQRTLNYEISNRQQRNAHNEEVTAMKYAEANYSQSVLKNDETQSTRNACIKAISDLNNAFEAETNTTTQTSEVLDFLSNKDNDDFYMSLETIVTGVGRLNVDGKKFVRLSEFKNLSPRRKYNATKQLLNIIMQSIKKETFNPEKNYSFNTVTKEELQRLKYGKKREEIPKELITNILNNEDIFKDGYIKDTFNIEDMKDDTFIVGEAPEQKKNLCGCVFFFTTLGLFLGARSLWTSKARHIR